MFIKCFNLFIEHYFVTNNIQFSFFISINKYIFKNDLFVEY